jgi:DinB superfamily
MIRLLREANLHMLASLSPAQLERSGNHAERGKITVRELARHMAAHDINHILQIERLIKIQQ